MVDRLAGFFEHYALTTRVFYSGKLCGDVAFDAGGGTGHLHLVRRGPVTVRTHAHAPLTIIEPSLLFYPRPENHSFTTAADAGADLVCATIDFDQSAGNPLTRALPAMLLMPFKELPELLPTLELLLQEASRERCGRQAAIDRLAGYLCIQILRHVLDSGKTSVGLLAGLADRRLARALTAVHQYPRKAWPMEKLAGIAGMSRARFAVHFRETLGMTPGEYLAQWRIGLAQGMLQRGKPLNLIADAVGYGSATALSRAFRAQTGRSPREWKRGS